MAHLVYSLINSQIVLKAHGVQSENGNGCLLEVGKRVGEGYANTFTKSYHLAVAKHFGPDVPFQPCTKVLSQS